MGPLGFSLSVTYGQQTSKTQIIIMVRTKLIMPVIMMIFLLPCCLSLPRFFNSKDQARQCATSFFRCCSSTKRIPYRCFELNRCPLNFFPLENYNEICSNIYDDSMEEIDSTSQTKMMMIMKKVIKNDMEEVIENDIEEVIGRSR